jgi:hypothetical protein
LGYASFPHPFIAKLKPSALLPLLKTELGGEVELMLISEGYDAFHDYLQKIQADTHGMAMFEHSQKVSAQRDNWWLAFARVEGEIVGLMMYALRGDRIMQYNFRAFRFYYTTSQGKYLLLSWVAQHTDQAGEVEIWMPPWEMPGTWLTDLQITSEPAFVAPMGRVLDVTQINGLQTGEGGFTARVTDPLLSRNQGVWKFETIDGKLQVSAAKEADCDLTIQGLSSLVYGTNDPTDFKIRGWGNPSTQVQDVMRGMFPKTIPFLHEMY